MKIGLICDSLGQKTGGIVRFDEILIQWLLDNNKEHEFHVFLPCPDYCIHFQGYERMHWHEWPKGFLSYYSKYQILKNTIQKYNLECLHYLENLTWFIFPGISIVSTVHDISPVKFWNKPWMSLGIKIFYLLNLKLTLKRASIIVTDSEASKKDICLFNNSREQGNIKVIYPGNPFNGQQLKPVLKLDKKPFILVPCTFQKRKNIPGMLKAFEQFKEKHSLDLTLVITGQRNVSKNEAYRETLKRLHEMQYKNDVIILEGVSHEEMQWLYLKAVLIFYVTFYEAFGFPIVESLISGTPVIAGNIGSCPEIGKDFALYCNPYDISQITACLEDVLIHKKYQLSKEEASSFVSSRYSLEQMGSGYLKVYEEAQRLRT